MLLAPAPSSPLNVPIGPHRRIAFVPARLQDMKAIKDVLGGTVNDVVLAVVAGALRRLYEFRGDPTDGVTLRVQVPVSTRGHDERGAFGNRVTQMVAPLPIGIADPVARLRIVSDAMRGLKESKQALGATAIADMQDFAPPTILAQASRLNFNNRMFNLLVTNVPGPQMPLYALGRELQSIFPIAFLAGDRALAVAIMSYNGGMNFGLLGDYDMLKDIDVVATGVEDALAELLTAAGVPARSATSGRDRGAGGAAVRSPSAPERPPARRGRRLPLLGLGERLGLGDAASACGAQVGRRPLGLGEVALRQAQVGHAGRVAQVPLGIERRLTARAGGGDRLAIGVVHEVSGGEHPRAVRPRRAALGHDVAVLVDVDLAAHDTRLGLVPDGDEGPADAQLELLRRSRCW